MTLAQDGTQWRNLLLLLLQLWILLPGLVKSQLQFITFFTDQHQRSYQYE